MDFAIFRAQKLKSTVAVRSSLKHAFREQETPNADPEKLELNSHIGAENTSEALKAFKDRLPEKIRKNGVLCIEYFVSASPEAMYAKTREEQDRYFTDALEWLKAKHGAENVFYAGAHRDESTPHMYAYVVPLDDKGKLNCRSFLGGHKDVMSEIQTAFAEEVGKKHGLRRGIEGSKAKHTTIKQFYTGLAEQEKREAFNKQDRIARGRSMEQTFEADMVDELKRVEVKALAIAPPAFNTAYADWQRRQEDKKRKDAKEKLDRQAAERKAEEAEGEAWLEQQREANKQTSPTRTRGFTR